MALAVDWAAPAGTLTVYGPIFKLLNLTFSTGKCETPSVLQGLEEWVSRRLRPANWKQWKRGADKDMAACTAGSAHGPWRLANTLALARALPNASSDSLGIPGLAVDR